MIIFHYSVPNTQFQHFSVSFLTYHLFYVFLPPLSVPKILFYSYFCLNPSNHLHRPSPIPQLYKTCHALAVFSRIFPYTPLYFLTPPHAPLHPQLFFNLLCSNDLVLYVAANRSQDTETILYVYFKGIKVLCMSNDYDEGI